MLRTFTIIQTNIKPQALPMRRQTLKWFFISLLIFNQLLAGPSPETTTNSPLPKQEVQSAKPSPYSHDITDIEPFDFWSQFSKMMLALFMILALVFIGSWLLKKTVSSRVKNMNKQNKIKIIERRALNPKAHLYLLEVENKKILVGESPSGIHALLEINSPNDFSQIMKDQESK
jgi:flagellar biosynthetic protein FliO